MSEIDISEIRDIASRTSDRPHAGLQKEVDLTAVTTDDEADKNGLTQLRFLKNFYTAINAATGAFASWTKLKLTSQLPRGARAIRVRIEYAVDCDTSVHSLSLSPRGDSRQAMKLVNVSAWTGAPAAGTEVSGVVIADVPIYSAYDERSVWYQIITGFSQGVSVYIDGYWM